MSSAQGISRAWTLFFEREGSLNGPASVAAERSRPIYVRTLVQQVALAHGKEPGATACVQFPAWEEEPSLRLSSERRAPIEHESRGPRNLQAEWADRPIPLLAG
jgi:hypothetical protein